MERAAAKSTLRVLHVNKLYFPWWGGVERSVQTIAEALSASCRVSVACCSPTGGGEVTWINGVFVKRYRSMGLLLGMPISPTLPLSLRDLIKDHDVIHFHMPFPLAAIAANIDRGALARKRVVVHFHSDVLRQYSLLWTYTPFLRKLLGRADRVIVTSPPLLESGDLQAVANKCVVIPNPINLDKVYPLSPTVLDAARVRAGVRPGERVVLFVGRFVYYKGLEFLVDAMKTVDARLVLVGAGPMMKTIRQRVSASGLGAKVYFTGGVPDEELHAFYSIADLFVLPSVACTEAFGIVQLEAMAHGLPVVNTQLRSGVPWVSVNGDTGLTVPPCDAGALADAIDRILSDGGLARQFSENGRNKVQRFAADRVVRVIRAAYLSAEPFADAGHEWGHQQTGAPESS